MKKLPLNTKQYQDLQKDYGHWLLTLGYSSKTGKLLPILIREMLHYMETKNIIVLNNITEQDIKDFIFQWKRRKNQTTGAGLSIAYTKQCTTAVNSFIRYIKVTGQHHLELKLPYEQQNDRAKIILTQEEIKLLYEASYNEKKRANTRAFGQRDRAMLAIYYGCGLRKNEGISLEVKDILIEKELVFVRKGKGDKERYVPITAGNLEDIKEYLNDGRKWFLNQRQKKKNATSTAFFLSNFGGGIKDFGIRINDLKQEAGITKPISLHTFRHSIATHLMQRGMDIELIRKFLGHASLESTQIYTHIVNEL